jgi:hypothetical protein
MSDHWREFIMQIVWYHVLVMCLRMMISEIVTHNLYLIGLVQLCLLPSRI